MDLPIDASSDQSNVPNGYYRRNTGMVNMIPTDNGQQFTPVKLTDEQLADKKYLRDLAMTELVDIVRKNNGDIKGIAAVRELLDRTEGKPAQGVELSGKDGGAIEVKEMSRLDVARRIAFLLAGGAIDAEFEEIK